MPDPLFFFSWCDESTPWSAELQRKDEIIWSLQIHQEEGELATLQIEIDNPGEGLLAPGRKRWVWLAWNDLEGGSVRPMFFGRLVALPDDLAGQTIDLEFTAEPVDWAEQKAGLAASLRVPPYWDTLFLQDKIDDPDTVLESRAAVYHGGRTDHLCTISDVLQGEDGTIEFLAEDMAYDGLQIERGTAPRKRVKVKATIEYQQQGTGTVDLTADLYAAMLAAGSPFSYPIVGSYTSQGLFEDWPKPLDDMGGGWSFATDSAIEAATWVQPWIFSVRYVDKNPDGDTQYQDPSINPSFLFFGSGAVEENWVHWNVGFPIYPLKPTLRLAYAADRKRTEVLTFDLTASMQAVVSAADDADERLIEVSSDLVAQPIDDGGAMPIGDLRRPSYFATARGNVSLKYLMLMGFADLAFHSRAATVRIEPLDWSKVWNISCRHNALPHDSRIPGGQCNGKVTSYTLTAAEGRLGAEVLVACSVGYDDVLPAPVQVADGYAEDYADDWTETDPGSTQIIELVAGRLQYEEPVGSSIIDDDGIDLFNMTPAKVLMGITVTNGPDAQRAIIEEAARRTNQPDPIGAVKDAETRIRVQVKPVVAGPFLSEFVITTLPVSLPKGIDLEAPSG